MFSLARFASRWPSKWTARIPGGDRGDTITATFNKTEESPYKAYNGKSYPIRTTATCTLHLSNGPPEVRIYAIAKEGEKYITGKETNIMIGQRIALSAHVVSYGLGHETRHEWDVKGRIFDQYWACGRKPPWKAM